MHDNMSKKKVVLITGGNSGLGKAIAQELILRGHVVYGTTRNLPFPKIEGMHFVKLDVTSETEIKEAIRKITRAEKRIDVIINNAGTTLTGPSLQFTVEDFKNILDINLIGAFRLFKIALSFPNKPKLIINITSLNGFLSLPNFGLYCASKFAMEGLGLALRYELAPLIKVVNVAPGALQMESAKKMPHKPAREKFPLLNWLMPLTSPEDVARAIEKLINASSVPPRVLVGRDAQIINLMQKVLPFSLFDRIVFYIWRKK
jgi:NAD(P)-dependent dehydrogenase (short-subunit alcohol dehydrogenase family)